ncbi:type II asparaginase [Aneurinibacillus sp. Ricciae_BoGa-3]|uniref:type II asparaginase n=1 Tax=Aneurinibacillus sp. Ricciae_BoGa-3 TaxID=3022697 RepID=UPI0023422F60|nr:type II asparaginase [Aneurinibacillus sp. Ricciae_BoGa-3]WCK54024.1 type II asparaginase [Aneurinibacillus sp. Ricciae_BoGa-3]
MKPTFKKILSTTLLMALGASGFQTASFAATTPANNKAVTLSQSAANHLKNIKILATGGTIAGTGTSNTQTTGYTAGVLGVDALIKAVPGLDKVANISGEQVANIDSSAMTNEIWLKLAKEVNAQLAKPDVDGVVITHGTDTLEETAYFLNLVVHSDKPVVLVGSMRPATATSADGPMNLYNAVALASSNAAKGKGVLVSLNDQINGARDVTKTNTTNMDTFKSPELGYMGYMLGGKAHFYNQSTKRHTTNSEFSVDDLKSLPRVDIVYSHENDGREFVDAAAKAGAKGIIHAGTGDGSVYPVTKEGLLDAQKKGIVVVRSSRVGNGIVSHEADDDVNHFVTSDNLNPQKARVLLMLALTKTNDPSEIQRMFDEY